MKINNFKTNKLRGKSLHSAAICATPPGSSYKTYLNKWGNPEMSKTACLTHNYITYVKSATKIWNWLPHDVGPPSRGLTTCRRDRKGPVLRGSGGSRRRGPRQPDPWTWKLALGTWNVTSLAGKEPEIVREVERFRLEIVGITSTHGWREDGLSTTLELPMVRGGGLVWVCL